MTTKTNVGYVPPEHDHYDDEGCPRVCCLAADDEHINLIVDDHDVMWDKVSDGGWVRKINDLVEGGTPTEGLIAKLELIRQAFIAGYSSAKDD